MAAEVQQLTWQLGAARRATAGHKDDLVHAGRTIATLTHQLQAGPLCVPGLLHVCQRGGGSMPCGCMLLVKVCFQAARGDWHLCVGGFGRVSSVVYVRASALKKAWTMPTTTNTKILLA